MPAYCNPEFINAWMVNYIIVAGRSTGCQRKTRRLEQTLELVKSLSVFTGEDGFPIFCPVFFTDNLQGKEGYKPLDLYLSVL
jgi:hypothetical protein